MKKFFSLSLLMSVILLGLSSCEKDTQTLKPIINAETVFNIEYNASEYSIEYSIENPIKGEQLSVATEADWIKRLAADGNKITFYITENNNNESRSGEIWLVYPKAEDVIITINQNFSFPEIITENESGEYGHEGGEFKIKYTIKNPRLYTDLTASCEADWIKGITVNEEDITFSVAENMITKQRETTLKLEYKSAETKYFQMTQAGRPEGCYDLSAKGTANCYIVSDSGLYSFKAVKGNSEESVGDVETVSVLWESFGTSTKPTVGDLIQEVKYNERIIEFKTNDTFREGNAVIAAKDNNGKILWSWHIWMTDTPQDQEYINNAGIIMDRNLGATSATPGDVGALGLMYQWGRKDPFLGSSSISENIVASSTIEWPSPVLTSELIGTTDYTIENPTTFIYSNEENHRDWFYLGTSTTPNNTLWQSEKTIYDPCPNGYQIPEGGSNGFWMKALKVTISETKFDDVNKGMDFGGILTDSESSWFPFNGHLSEVDPVKLDFVGTMTYLSTYTSGKYHENPILDMSYTISALYLNDQGYVVAVKNNHRAYGSSVRCVRQ